MKQSSIMKSLPWFKPKPLKVGDRYPITDHERVVEVTKEARWKFPSTVTHEIAYVERDGTLSKFRDGTNGRNFVNVWGIEMLRTKTELLRYRLTSYVRDLRKRIANKIYPLD